LWSNEQTEVEAEVQYRDIAVRKLGPI